MSRIPDCRTDHFYNYEHLTDEDKCIIDGYDKAVTALESAYDFAIESDSLIEHLMNTELPESLKDEDCEYAKNLIYTLMTNYLETTRDEIITSMIDGYVPEHEEEEKDGNI